jgi:proteic killer suppression protein
MIVSFRHKGLQELYATEKTRRLPQERLEKINLILGLIDSAKNLGELNRPGFRLHRLGRPPLEGYYSIDISGNYRLVFRFFNGNAMDIDFLDTH